MSWRYLGYGLIYKLTELNVPKMLLSFILRYVDIANFCVNVFIMFHCICDDSIAL